MTVFEILFTPVLCWPEKSTWDPALELCPLLLGSQQCLALDGASADLRDVVIEQKMVSLSQSFQAVAEDILQGSSSEIRTTWWRFTLIQQERVKEIIGLLNNTILYWGLKRWGSLAELICPLRRVAATSCLDRWLAWAEKHLSLVNTRNHSLICVH